MKPELCSQLTHELEKVRELKNAFDLELANALVLANTKKARELQIELERQVSELSEKFFLYRMVEQERMRMNHGLNKRFADFGSSMSFDIQWPEIPEEWTKEHVQILHEIFGENNLEPRIVPTPDDLHDLNFEYLKIMYPEAEISSDGERLKAETNAYDRANGLVSFSVDPQLNNRTTAKNRNNFIRILRYRESMANELKNIGGKVIFMETIQKPLQENDSYYGKEYDAQENDDNLLSFFLSALQNSSDRFWYSWVDIETDVIPKIEKKIEKCFLEHELPVPKFTVMMIPALMNNLDMTLYHKEQSLSKFNEWSSTRVEGKPEECLISGRSIRGGASYVDNASIKNSSMLIGVRFALLLG